MKREVVLGLLIIPLIVGCAGNSSEETLDVRRTLGISKAPPDHFSIIKNRPLTMPQDMANLPQPTPGAGNPTAIDPIADAQRALSGEVNNTQTVAMGSVSSSEQALLTQIQTADPNIRQIIEQDSAEARSSGERRSLLDRYNPFLRNETKRDDVIDPVAELGLVIEPTAQ